MLYNNQREINSELHLICHVSKQKLAINLLIKRFTNQCIKISIQICQTLLFFKKGIVKISYSYHIVIYMMLNISRFFHFQFAYLRFFIIENNTGRMRYSKQSTCNMYMGKLHFQTILKRKRKLFKFQ